MAKYPVGNYRQYVLDFYPNAKCVSYEEFGATYYGIDDGENMWGCDLTEEDAWKLTALCIFYDKAKEEDFDGFFGLEE